MVRAEARVAADPLEALSSACHDAYGSAWAELDTRLGKSMLGAIGAAREGLSEAEAVTAAQGDNDDRVAEYRRVIASQVLEPLVRTLQHTEPIQRIERVFSDAHAAALASTGRLPAAVRLPWREEALRAGSWDGLWRALGKPLARVFSPARRPGEDRLAPVRDVGLRHLRDSTFPGQSRRAEHAMRRWVGWSVDLEAAFGAWGEVALPILTSPAMEVDADAWTELRAAARDLDAVLLRLESGVPHADVAREALEALARSRGALDADLGVAGTFLFRAGAPPKVPTAALGRAAARWSAWTDRALARLQLQRALLAMLSGAHGVQERLAARMAKACLAPTEHLPALADALRAVVSRLRNGEVATAKQLAAARADAGALVDEVVASVPRSLEAVTAIQQLADSTVEALQAMVRQMPARLVLRTSAAQPRALEGPEGRALALQDLTRAAFDALRIERVREATMGVLERYQQIRAGIDGLPEVVAFGFDAGLEELDAPGDDAGARAVEMAIEGLERAADTVGGVPEAIERAIAETRAGVAEEVGEGCEGILERAGARGVQAQVLAARSRFSALRVGLNETLGPPLALALRRVQRTWVRARVLVTSGVRRGGRIVGTEADSSLAAARSLRTLGSEDGLGAAIPLVYRKLFASEPLADPALLAGRDAELRDALERWRQWRESDGVPFVVRARPGHGVTSFLNAFVSRIQEEEGDASRVNLDERIACEADLSRMLAGLLGVEACDSVDQLARSVLRAPEESLPDAVAIDGLEHLYLRVPGGTDVLERMLTFMAETEPRVFWIAGITTSAWQFIAKAEPNAAAQVDTIELPGLSVADLRVAVLARHRRSGITVRYEEPSEGRRLLQRRLRRLRGTARHQQILEEDFFERLDKASSRTIGLALHLWLAAADFTWRDGQVLMRPLAMPDFSVLAGLDLNQNFTLKALLELRTLTLAEHDAIFRIPRHESYQIFELLGNRRLIECVPAGASGRMESEVVEGLRYRVRPVLTGAVLSHLQSRNIVH